MSKCKDTIIKTLVLAGFLLIGYYLIPTQTVYAAGPAKVYAVEYYDENIIVFNNDNKKIYFATDSDAANNRWDVITAEAGNFTAIDISWLSTSDDNVIMIKGDVDPTPSRIVIKEKPEKLTVSVNYGNLDSLSAGDTIAPIVNIMSTVGTGDSPITFDDLEWKKGVTGRWTSTRTLTKTLLEQYLVKGVYLNFRIRAVDDCVDVKLTSEPLISQLQNLNENRIAGNTKGIRYYDNNSSVVFGTNYPDGTKGRRFSGEVKVKIAKKSAVAVTGVSSDEFTAAIKYGKEYKVKVTYAANNYGNSDWTKITDKSVKTITLAQMANNVLPKKLDSSSNVIVYDGIKVGFPAMNIEVRDYATTKAASSNIYEIVLDAQRTLTKAVQKGVPNLTLPQSYEDIYVSYAGTKYVLLTIPKADVDLQYEYCIVKPGDTFTLERAAWTAVTKGTGVKLIASKAPDGGKLYIRQKEIAYKASTKLASAIAYKLASTCVSIPIDYPSIPVVTEKTYLTYVKEFTTAPQTITVQLNTSGKIAYEDTVKSIKLGTKIINFTTNTVKLPTDNSISIMTITLNNSDISLLTNCYNKALTITYLNGTVDKTSVKLTVKNKTASGTLSLLATKGTSGKPKVSVVNTAGLDNSFVYAVGAEAITGKYIEDVFTTGKAFKSGDEIAEATLNQYITIYEINKTNNIIKCGSIKVTSEMLQ